MKIINNSIKCNCGIIFTYDDDETEIDEEKEKYVICPRCGKHNFTKSCEKPTPLGAGWIALNP